MNNSTQNNLTENRMASRQGLLNKFFQNWKNKRLNRAADKLVKDNPDIEKALKNLDNAAADLLKKLQQKNRGK